MAKIRILVVDDSAVFRRLVSDELASDPGLEVVGAAANGRIALARMTQVNPDLVILDVEMPEMDGLETLKELRKSYRRLPVIMFSALTERGAEPLHRDRPDLLALRLALDAQPRGRGRQQHLEREDARDVARDRHDGDHASPETRRGRVGVTAERDGPGCRQRPASASLFGVAGSQSTA